MKVYIYNCSNTFNYGSMMMGENFISYFNEITKSKNTYYVETENEINVLRLREASGIEEIIKVNLGSLFTENIRKINYFLAYINNKRIYTELANEIDLVVVLGGDDFTEDYGWKGPVINALKFNLLRKNGLKVIMLGQTMGPFLSFRKLLMKHLLSGVDKIYPRDLITYKYLCNNLGLKNIEITDDLALLPLNKQELKPKSKEYITYCPSELIYRYSKEGARREWVEYNLFMIDTIITMYPEKKIVLLAHVLVPVEADDRIIAKEIYDLIKDKYKDRVILEISEMFPYEVRNYIQQSYFTISSRMHPAVSSIQSEIPVITLSYSSKYWGIIGERYGLSQYIIDVRQLDYSEMRLSFIDIVKKIELNYKKIQEQMSKNNKQAINSIYKTLNEIAKLK
ncbi:polysaccharide pyruvyl transferase family protein [Paenibacillus sp. FSL H3-0333]|uniref:polysaccharide pyruvyl transferase family protein n=1 Tax=Paenibacillus sp. FSL H3-0333 TaxID=2921373 RepID=UPI0030F4E68E